MTPETMWRGLDLAKEAMAGATASQIADKVGTTDVAVRTAANRRNVCIPHETPKAALRPRDHIQDMKPLDAIEYLLGLVETMMPYLDPVRDHEVDRLCDEFTPSERAIVTALVDAAPLMLTHGQIYSIVYGSRPNCEMPGPSTITVYISKARKKMPATFGEIETVRGRGYRFVRADQ